jgi:hypothetical protein
VSTYARLCSFVQPLVLTTVTVPLPAVWILVNLATVLPDGAGRLPADNRGADANSPTGCRTGRAGGVRIHSLISASVASPLGFTTANGRKTDDPTPAATTLLLLLLSAPLDGSFSVRAHAEMKLN